MRSAVFKLISTFLLYITIGCCDTLASKVELFDHVLSQVDTLENGSLLIGDVAGYLYTYDGQRKTKLSEKSIGYIHFIAPYQGGHLIASANGLTSLRKGRLQKVGQLSIDASAWFMQEGKLYVLAKEGLFELKGDQLIQLVDRFQDDKTISYYNYVSVGDKKYILGENYLRNVEEPKDTLYAQEEKIHAAIQGQAGLIIGDNQGLFQIINGQAKNMILEGEVFNLPVKKLHRIDKKSWTFSTDNKSYLWNSETYSLTLVDHKLSYLNKTINDIQNDRWSNTWAVQGRALHLIVTSSAKSSPKITLTKIEQDGQALALEEAPFRFRTEENSLDISFSAIDLNPKSTIINEYSLDGQTWIKTKNTIELNQLNPGKYTVKIRSTSDQKYYTYSDGVVFYIADKTLPSWLIGLLLLGILGIISALWLLWRNEERQDKSRLEKSKLIAENEALKQGQKALQLQMNPHFVFNAINSIQGLIAQGKNDKASLYLSKFSSLMRSVLDHSRKEWIPLEDEIKYLKDYLHLEQMCRGGAFEFTVNVDPEILEEDLETLPMINQPFIENAIVHGISHMKEGGQITIDMSLLDDLLKVVIIDNGKGYEPKNSSSSHESVALSVVQDRLKSSKYKKARYTIQNLNKSSSVQGTKVEVYLPVR